MSLRACQEIMSELADPIKTCGHCGAVCALKVLVCPKCSRVLPDSKPQDEVQNGDLVNDDQLVVVRKLLIFAVIMAAVLWFASTLMQNS